MTRTFRPSLSWPLMLALPVLLAACGDEAEVSTEDDGREASGEVLEGTISDAMLPVDELQSQAPPRQADPEAPASSSSGSAEPEPAEETAAEPAESAPAEPEAEPAE